MMTTHQDENRFLLGHVPQAKSGKRFQFQEAERTDFKHLRFATGFNVDCQLPFYDKVILLKC